MLLFISGFFFGFCCVGGYFCYYKKQQDKAFKRYLKGKKVREQMKRNQRDAIYKAGPSANEATNTLELAKDAAEKH